MKGNYVRLEAKKKKKKRKVFNGTALRSLFFTQIIFSLVTQAYGPNKEILGKSNVPQKHYFFAPKILWPPGASDCETCASKVQADCY